MSKQLAMWLEGHLQSWGCNRETAHHGTLRFPTKSGVIGMILAALGNDGSDTDMIRKLSYCPMTVYAFEKKTPVTVLQDFQTAGSGWCGCEKRSWETLMRRRNRNGGLLSSAAIMKKDYLEDATFCVVWDMDEDILSEVEQALLSPVWPLYLGRRNCPPSAQVFLCSGYEVSSEVLHKASDRGLHLKEVVIEGKIEDSYDSFVLADVPIAYFPERRFTERWVSIIKECREDVGTVDC